MSSTCTQAVQLRRKEQVGSALNRAQAELLAGSGTRGAVESAAAAELATRCNQLTSELHHLNTLLAQREEVCVEILVAEVHFIMLRTALVHT
jgi:hypothetical protein